MPHPTLLTGVLVGFPLCVKTSFGLITRVAGRARAADESDAVSDTGGDRQYWDCRVWEDVSCVCLVGQVVLTNDNTQWGVQQKG